MSENFKTGYDISVFKTDHSLNFSVSHCRFPRLKLPFKGFNCKLLLSLFIHNLVDNTKRALTQ